MNRDFASGSISRDQPLKDSQNTSRRTPWVSLTHTVVVTLMLLSGGWRMALADEPEAALSRIGFVDIPYLIDRAPQALEAERRLETEFAPRQKELEYQRAQLAELAARLADTSLEMTEVELTQLERETRSLERRVKRSEQDFREELNIQKNNEFKNVRILVLEAIADFGRQQDYDLIVSDGVLFANKRIDVTERILESLERESERLKSTN